MPIKYHQVVAAVDELMQNELVEEAKQLTVGTSWGTVRCVVLLQADELINVNLGDCRAVLCEHGKVSMTTSDHIPEKMTRKSVVEGTSLVAMWMGRVQVSRLWRHSR